jgi:hypothetical protein
MADIKVEVIQNVNEVSLSQEVVIIDLGFGGPQGPRGNSVLSGYGAPSVYLGIAGDHYIDKDTNDE